MEKLLWIDLEMTGLNVDTEVIIEVAAIITDLKLQPLDEYHSVIKQPQKYLDAMDEWNSKHHGDSGLTAQIPGGKEPAVAESELIAFCQKHFPKEERIILAGNSIGQDRLFIDKYFSKMASLLHYRMLDVSSFKIWFQAVHGKGFQKKNSHRAIEDILESINEFKYYTQFINIS